MGSVTPEDESRIARAGGPPEARDALRTTLIAARRRSSPERRRADNDALLARLQRAIDDLIGDLRGKILGVYWPIRGEPDLGTLPERWTGLGATLALPVVDAPCTPLRFLAWSPEAPTVPGAWGIPRPARERAVRPGTLIVPCVGFDTGCWRLGYGGGFYDRTLEALARGGCPPRTIGVAWDEGRLEGFEPLPTDRPLDAVVTPSATLLRSQPPAAR